MKIFVLGANGQLGQALCRRLSKDQISYKKFDKDNCDIGDFESVKTCVQKEKPSIIVNCAAYTQVDRCETEKDTAYAVNGLGAKYVSLAAESVRAKLIHISTDFVFDGKGDTPYIEFDKPNPQSVYGKSKWAGEEAIRLFCPKHFIVRTSWLYGHGGKNFVNTMLDLSKTCKEISVVSDQIGAPTYVEDLVEALVLLFSSENYGTYHFSGSGECSWYEFAKTIFEMAGKGVSVKPISTKDYNAPAPRPAYSVMDNYMFRCAFSHVAPNWKDSLKQFLQNEELYRN